MDNLEYLNKVLNMTEEAMKPKEVHKCFLCGHIGEDVNRVMYRHVGGDGEVPCPMCDDKQACFKRLDEAEREWKQSLNISR